MRATPAPEIDDVRSLFADALDEEGGRQLDGPSPPEGLHLRGVLSHLREAIRPGFSLTAGVGLEALADGTCVQTYLCISEKDGGLLGPPILTVPPATTTRKRGFDQTSRKLRPELGAAIRRAVEPRVFSAAIRRVRLGLDGPDPGPDRLVRALPGLLERLGRHRSSTISDRRDDLEALGFRMVAAFLDGGDPTRLGAVLAVARTAATADPYCRWRFEEIAGSLAGLDGPLHPEAARDSSHPEAP